jgi:hypothetical protein
MARKPEVSHEPALGHGQRVLLYDACCLQQPIRCRQTCGSQPACPTPVIHPRDCSRFSAVCPNGRACPLSAHRSTIHDGRRRAARSCDVSALTRGLTAVLRVISATIRFSIVHTQHTRCAVCTDRDARRRTSPSAEPCARTNTPARKRKRATRGSTRTGRLRMWNVRCAARATCTSDVDDACAREPTAKHSQTHDTTSRHASGRYPTPVHACIYTHLTHANTPAASTERTPAGTGFCAFLGATAHFCAKVNAAQRVLQGNAAACRRPPRPLGAQ